MSHTYIDVELPEETLEEALGAGLIEKREVWAFTKKFTDHLKAHLDSLEQP